MPFWNNVCTDSPEQKEAGVSYLDDPLLLNREDVALLSFGRNSAFRRGGR